MIDFDTFKQQIRKAAHENHACVDGYRQMMASESYTQMLRVMYNNWDWVYDGGFYHLFCRYFGQWFEGHEADFHAADVFYNEPSEHGFVFVDNPGQTLVFHGQPKVFILAPSDVDAYDKVEVHCRADFSHIHLYGSSYGLLKKGYGRGYDYSRAESWNAFETHDHASLIIRDGICFDFGHERIRAYHSMVFGTTSYHIELNDDSRLMAPSPSYYELYNKEK